MNEEALKLLYDSYAKDKGFRDYDEFKGLIADDDARKLFFEDSNNDLGFKDQSDFEDTIGFKKKADTWQKSALEQMLPSWQSKSGSQSPSEGAATAVKKTSTQEESQVKKGSLVGVNDSETAVNIWAHNSELAANKNKPSGPVISKAYEDEFNGVVKQKVDSLNSVYGARLESQLSAAKKNIEGNIKLGKVTPEEADQLLSQLNQEYTDKANSDFSNDANSEYDKIIKSYEDKTKKKIEKDSRLAAEKSVKDKNRKPFRDAGMTEDQIDQLEGMVKKRNETGEDDSAITKFISGFGVKAADILFNAAPMSNAAVSNMFMNDFYEQKKEDIKKNLTGKNAGSIDPTNLARINNKNYKDKLEQLMLNDIVLSPKDEAVRDALQMVYETIGSTGADKSQDLFEDNFETFYNKVISNKKLANNEEIRKQQSESVELLGNIPKSWDEAKETGEWAKYVGGAMGNFAGSAAYGVGTLGAGIYTLNTGEVYNTIMENLSKDISEKTGQKMTKDDLILSGLDGDALGTAKAVGVMVSALDAGGLFMGAGRVATGAFKKKIVDTAIKDFIKRGSKSIALRAASQFAKETAIPLVSEAATEMAQSYIPAVASNILAAKIRAGQSFDESIMSLSPEETQEVLESGIQAIIGMGAVAPIGGAGAAFRSVEADLIENDRSEKFEVIKDKNGNQFIVSKEKPTTKIVKKEDGTLTSIVSEGNKPDTSQTSNTEDRTESDLPKSTTEKLDVISGFIDSGKASELTLESAEKHSKGKDKVLSKLGRVAVNLFKVVGKIKSAAPRVVLLHDNQSAKAMARALGNDVGDNYQVNGWYSRDIGEGGTMFITPNTNTAIHEIMMHPVIDALKQTAPERYEEFIQQVAQLKTKDKEGNETTFLDKAKKNYEDSSAEVINEEAVVDYLSGIADKGFDSNFLQKIVELFEKYFNVKVGEFNINLDNPTDVQIFAKDLTKALRQSRPVVLTKDQTVPASARVQIDEVKSRKKEGVTFNPDFSEYTGEDDVVTIASENVKESELTPERINEFKLKHQESLKEKNVKIGIFNMGDGNYSIDLNVTQPFEKQANTKEFAKQNNQKAIYSPKGGGVIETGGTGETTIKSPSEAAETIKKLNSGNNPSSVNNKNTDSPSDPAVKFQIELFHSSPYRFNEFKSSQVGKGVGKQMLGWGFYFLDKEAPTKVYATSSFQGRVLPKYTGKYKAGNIDVVSRLRGEFYGDVGLYKAKLEKESGKLFGSKSAKEEMNQLNKLSEELDRDSVGRFTYNTTAHKGKSPSEYDYLEGGSNLTDAQVHKIGFDTSTTGHQAYESLAKSLGGDKEASMYLLDRGIDGIKYSDGNIFANKDRSKGNNVYVVFDERAISIDRAISFSKTNEYKDNSSKTQEFFSDVVTGKSDKFKPVRPYSPIMKNNKDQEEFNKEYSKLKGNFDEHIATSIPGFRDVQVKKGRAIIDTLPEGGLVIDIAGSEGGLNKSITKISNGKIKTINLDVNKDMQSAHNTNPVKGAEFKLGAFFNDYEEDGFTAKRWIPENKADIVHESMGFQFMSPQRELHIKEAKDNYLKPDGMLIVEEKVGNPQWEENEIKKDINFKSRFYTKEQIEEKNKAVKVSDFDANEGMAGNMVTEEKLLRDLGDNFSHVQQYWDAGNFKGYVASNDKTKIDKFIKSIGSTNTEFSNRSDDQLKSISFSKDRVSSPELLSIKDQYNTDNKVIISQVDPNGVFTQENIKRVEKLHRDSKDDRTSDEVLDTYKAFMDETMEMYNTLIDNGYKIEPWTKPGEPYGVNSDLVRKDINENKHLYYLRSKAATGANEQSSLDDSYPLFRETGIVINGEQVLYNDLFRAVHDIFGHGIYKNSFSTQGEFKAYQAHSNMYTEAAQSALFLETVSYNAYYSVNKEYAPRKMYVVPDSIIKPIRESAPAKSNISFSQEKGAERRSNPVSFQAELGANDVSKPVTALSGINKGIDQVYSDRGLISKAERVERDNLPTAKPLANVPFSKEKVDKSFTLKGGNKIVDSNGDPIILYHGTHKDFKGFDPLFDYENIPGNIGQIRDYETPIGMVFLSDSKERTKSYGGKTISVIVKSKKILKINAGNESPDIFFDNDYNGDNKIWTKFEDGGYDLIEITGKTTKQGNTRTYIAYPENLQIYKEDQALFSKEKVTKTTERVVAPENSEFENLHNAFDASNPDPRFTGKSQETKKMLDKMSSMTDDEISQEAQKMGSDKLLDLAKSFQGNQNFSLLFLIEQMKRAARANDNAAVDNAWDAVNQIGHTVGQLLAQMRALQSAADNNQIIKRIIDRVFKKAGVNLTNDQKAELSDLVEKYVITAAEEKKQYERYDVNRTPVNKGRLDKSRQNARAAAEDLQIFIDDHVPETLMDTLGTLLRGNLLSPISLGRNVFGNTISMVTSFTEAGIVYPMAAKLASPRNARFLPYWVIVMAGARGGWTTIRTLFPSVFDAYFGTHFLPTDDIISNKFEIRRQLRPLRSAKKLFTTLPREIRSGEKSVPQGLKEGLQNLLYATAGIPASLMFKALQATDAPFAEGFKAYHDYIEFYSQKKNAGKSISNLEDFQRNLTESQKSSRAKFARTGLFSDPDSFAAKAARKIITQTPQEITRYTSENFPRFIAEPFNAALLFFRDAMAPYTTVPSNVVWTLMEYAVPALPLIESIQQFKKGNKVLASQLMGRAMNGVAMYYTAALIMEAGLMIDGDDDKNEKNDKQLKYAVGQPYGLNVDGLARLVSGGDPTRLDTDRIIDSRMLGQPGLFMAYYSNYNRKLKESGIDERPADFIQESVDKITIGASEGTRLSLDMSFMMGIETALTSLFNVDQEAKGIGYFPGLASQTLDTYSNAIWPNTVSQAIIGSQNQGPLSVSRESFAKNLSERVAKKHFFFMSPDDLYPTLDIWGNKIENKEGIKNMANLWKSRTQRDPQAWEVIRLMDSTGEENPIYIATPSIEVDTEEGKVRLNLQDSDKFLLASLSGRFTHMLISAAMNDPQYTDLSDAERVVVIKDQNTEGRRIARDIFEGLFMNDIEDGKITITDKKKGSYERAEKSTPKAQQKQSDEIINNAN